MKFRFLIIFEESSKTLMMVFTEDSHFIGSERRILSVNRGQHGSINEVEKDLICNRGQHGSINEVKKDLICK